MFERCDLHAVSANDKKHFREVLCDSNLELNFARNSWHKTGVSQSLPYNFPRVGNLKRHLPPALNRVGFQSGCIVPLVPTRCWERGRGFGKQMHCFPKKYEPGL